MEKLRKEKNGFRLRGEQMTRIDAFSDVVFGFALTLLVVSLEVPKTFTELESVLSGYLAFAICFYFLLWVWYMHYKFFRRYGLEDNTIIILNAILLFVVLYFVFPMKFLFNLFAFPSRSVAEEVARPPIHDYQVPSLMMLYGLGFAAVYGIFCLLYIHAWRKRDELHLNAMERSLTAESLVRNACVASLGLLCILIASIVKGADAGKAGFIFFLIAPMHAIIATVFRRRRKALITEI